MTSATWRTPASRSRGTRSTESVAQAVADQRDAREAAVDADEDLGVAAVEIRRQLRLDVVRAEPACAADEHAVVADRPADALAELLLDLLRDRQREVALFGAGDERLRQRV